MLTSKLSIFRFITSFVYLYSDKLDENDDDKADNAEESDEGISKC